MELEHPELDKFEPVLGELVSQVCEGGIQALRRAGRLRNPEELIPTITRSASANRRFLRGCHYAWDLAQRKIAKLVVEYRNEVRRLRHELKADRRNRNQREIKRKFRLLVVLEARQIVLRRLADAILYHMIKMETWITRHIFVEYHIREIDTATLVRTVEIATDLNRQDRMDFHLVSDLTTVVQVGDLIRVSAASNPPQWTIIELKEGQLNAALSTVIQKGGGELKDEDARQIRDQFGAKAVSQAKRMLRQEVRSTQFVDLINSEEGTDIMYKIPTRFFPEVVHVRNYCETLGRMCLDARASRLKVSFVDKCLRLLVMDQSMFELLGRTGIAHLLYHLQFEITECTLRRDNTEELERAKTIFPFFDLVRMNLYSMWPPPIFAWPLPKDLIFDLLFGRLRAFAQLDYDRLFDIADAQGIDMKWATGGQIFFPQVARTIPGSPNAKGVSVRLRELPQVDGQTLLVGFFGRMFLEFMSPSQFLEVVRAGFHESAKASSTGGPV